MDIRKLGVALRPALVLAAVIATCAWAQNFRPRSGIGAIPAWHGIYCEFRTNPVGGKRAAGDPTGTENDRNLFTFGGHGNVPALTLEHNPISTQTILAPVVAANGLDLGSQDQTDDDGMQWHTGAEAMALGAGQFVTRTTAFYAQFLDIVVADVSGTDDLAFGLREVEAVAAAIDDYTDLACLNIISGTVTQETILGNAATTTDSSGFPSVADAGRISFRIMVDIAGVTTMAYSTDRAYSTNGIRQRQSWTSLNSVDTDYTFADALNVGPFIYAKQAADVMGVVTIRGLEAGVGSPPNP